MVSRRNMLKLGAGCCTGVFLPNILHANTPTIKLGEINSYIPELEKVQTPYRHGWLLALEEINERGGIKGRKLEIISRNDEGDPDKATSLANFLVEKEGVNFLFGSVLSNIALALSKAANEMQIPFLATETRSDSITWEEGGKYTFSMRPNTYMVTKMLVNEAARLPVNRWACIAPDYEFGHTAVQHFKNNMNQVRPDIQWVHDEWAPLFKMDRNQLIKRMKDKNIEAIFNATFADDLQKLLNVNTQEKFFEGKSVVSLFSGEPEYIEAVSSPICDSWIVTGYPWQQIKTNAHMAFVKKYQSRFAESPTHSALSGYIALNAIAAAYQNSDDGTPDTLIKAMENLYFDSPLGTIRFRAQDRQSSMGTFVGKLAYFEGKSHMRDWYYADGADYWHGNSQVRLIRPQQ
ncbi:MAG: ABC transporter substrate-binding protein [Methylocystaceae bacterium]|nr:ABC transporter substrate-binding protein [Methylocystaceae bacterium]